MKWAAKMRTAADETAAMWPSDIVKRWREDVEMWQTDPTMNEDPFAEPEHREYGSLYCRKRELIIERHPAGLTLKDAQRKLAESEQAERDLGTHVDVHDMSASEVLRRGLALQERQ